jgi:hypothetical protein
LEIENKEVIKIIFYYMYNEHFQYGQRLGNSGFGTDSSLKPGGSRQMAPRVQSEPLGAPNPNSLIIQKI